MMKDITVQKRKAHYWVLHLLIHRPHSCRGGFLLTSVSPALPSRRGLYQPPHIEISLDHIPSSFGTGWLASSLRIKRMLGLTKSRVHLFSFFWLIDNGTIKLLKENSLWFIIHILVYLSHLDSLVIVFLSPFPKSAVFILECTIFRESSRVCFSLSHFLF